MKLHVIDELRARLHLHETIRTMSHDFEARVAQLCGEDDEGEPERQLPLEMPPPPSVRGASRH